MRRASGDQADVLVIGGGMAGLCAAISARVHGASVCLIEASPRHMRGGNLRHARNIRIPHDAPGSHSPGIYQRCEFEREIMNVSGGKGDVALVRQLADGAADLADWLLKQGVVFQKDHIPFSRKTVFFLGGGGAVVNALYAKAETLGIEIRYQAKVEAIDLDNPPAVSIVVCCGSHSAGSLQRFVNRGTPFNTGELTENLMRAGAASIGCPTGAHFVAVDARSPVHDGGIVTRIDGMEFGMVVDTGGRRFTAENAVTGSRRYSVWGRKIAELSPSLATLVVDVEGYEKMPVMAFPPIKAETLAELAGVLDVDPAALSRSAKDCGRVSKAPFLAYPLTPGFTFGCHGLHVDTSARVRMHGVVREDLFAAGAIMAAGILHTGYLSGTALTISAVYGRIAGEEAARHALG